jgi:hypothetical protein
MNRSEWDKTLEFGERHALERDALAASLPGDKRNVEETPKNDLEPSLLTATRDTQEGRYYKTRHGFDRLALIDPVKSKRVPHLQTRSTAFCDRCQRRLLIEVHTGTVTTSLELRGILCDQRTLKRYGSAAAGGRRLRCDNPRRILVQHFIKTLSNIFCKKPQHKIAILLQQSILTPVTPVCFGAGKMLLPVQLNSYARPRKVPAIGVLPGEMAANYLIRNLETGGADTPRI